MVRLARRQIRLPADRQSPGAARAAVQALLAETNLTELLDDAMLLTTELTTNAVLHAGTEIDLQMSADGASITVEVSDRQHGDLPHVDADEVVRRPMAQNGRGLLLVNELAYRWGTIHNDSGKTVWFQLRRDAPPARPLSDSRSESSVPTRSGHPRGAVDAAEHRALGGVVGRLVAFPEVDGAEVRVDRADGQGVTTTAYGEAVSERHARRVRLPLGEPWRGELLVRLRPSDRTVGARTPDPIERVVELSAQCLGLMLDNDRLHDVDLRRRESLTFMSEASELLAQSLDVELTAALIPRLLVPRFGEWCAVYRCAEDDEPDLAAATHTDETALGPVLARLDQPVPRRALRDVIRNGYQGVLPAGIDGIAVPLVVAGRRLGVLAVGRPPYRRHDGDELTVVGDLARRAALAMDKAATHAERVRITDTLQQALLPPALPDLPGLGFGAEYIPTIGDADVGGDFYDVLLLDDGRCLMVIGDVSGKGVAAAAVTGLVRDVIRILAREGRSLPEILRRINETLAERGAGRFATLAAAVVTTRGAVLDVALHLAGHDKPILVRANGSIEAVGVSGTALGLLPDIRAVNVDLTMTPGDTLVFFTDGVTERRRGEEFFGAERTCAVLAPLAGYDADIVAARLRAAVVAFSTEPPRDDIAILALRNDGHRG